MLLESPAKRMGLQIVKKILSIKINVKLFPLFQRSGRSPSVEYRTGTKKHGVAVPIGLAESSPGELGMCWVLWSPERDEGCTGQGTRVPLGTLKNVCFLREASRRVELLQCVIHITRKAPATSTASSGAERTHGWRELVRAQ